MHPPEGVGVVKVELLRGILRVQLLCAPSHIEVTVEWPPVIGGHLTRPRVEEFSELGALGIIELVESR